jgi:hypothetical protein
MMGKWRTFQRLSWTEKGTFFLAFLLLPITALALWLRGLRRTQAVLMRLAPVPNPLGEDENQEQQNTRYQQTLAIARLVRAAATHGPYRANCLKQSLLLWWLLRLRGIESDLRLGVSKAAAGMEAHAWVECEGRPLNDREDVGLRFTPFRRAIVPG